MATFKEVADYILSLPIDQQHEDAIFCDKDHDNMAIMTAKNIKMVKMQDIGYIEEELGEKFHAIMCSDDKIDNEYKHFID